MLIGVDVGGTNIRALLIDDRDVRVVARASASTPHDADELAARVAEVVSRHLNRTDVHAPVGLAVAGLAHRSGTVHYSPNIACLVQFPLAERVAEHLGHEVVLGNDANAACWAEYRIGAGQGVNDLVLVTVGTGIGTGMVVGGRLLDGAHGFAGESGHMVIDQHGPRHHTGQRGPWEMTAAGTSLMTAAQHAINTGDLHLAGELSPTSFAAVLATGDATAVRLVDGVAQQIALGCANMVMVLDPARIVIGGGVSALGEPLRAAIATHLHNEMLGAAYRPPVEVVLAALGDDAGAIGAALWARDAYEKFSK